jgi:1,4-dihydroxy-2-naphthoate octaprenyltransferase
MKKASEPGSLPGHIIREAVLGNRGLTKLNGLWLPLALFLTAGPGLPPRAAFGTCARIALAIGCWLLAAVLANDIADRRADEAAGKTRWINRLPAAAGIPIVVSLTGLGLAVPILSHSPWSASGSLGAAAAAGFAYSLRPLRLKERSLAGLAAYSLSCAFGYVLVPWAWLGATQAGLSVAAPAVFLDKWTNLHFHQVTDFAEDRRDGTKTYAVRAGLGPARRSLLIAAGASSLAFAAALFYAAALLERGWRVATLILATAFGSAIFLYIRKRPRALAPPLAAELPGTYLVLAPAVSRMLPLLLFVRLAALDAAVRPVAAAAAVLVGLEAVSLLRSPRHLGRRAAG